MNSRRTAGLSLALVTILACAGGDAGSAIAERDSAGITVVDNDITRLGDVCPVSAAPTVTIGTAEGDSMYELHRVFGARRLNDGRIVLVNQGSQHIRFYDQAGKFLMHAGRAGEGPGEFRDAFYLWVVRGDTVWVGDYRPWQFNLFAPNATFVRAVRPMPLYMNPPGAMAVLDDGRAVLADRTAGEPNGPQFALRRLTLVVHAPDGMLTDTIGTYDNGRYGQLSEDRNAVYIYPLFESFARIDAAGSRIFVAHGSKAEVVVFDAVGTPKPERVVRWNAGDRSISTADVAAERTRLADQYKTVDAAMRQRLVEPLISDKRPIADEFPAFSNLIAGRDGRLWIREFKPPTTTEPARWLAFDQRAHFQCAAALPALDNLFELGSDYMIGLDRDDAGVERVVQYSIGAPVPAR